MNQIANNPTAFVESLDSVRDASDNPEEKELRRLQATVESIVSLLLGEQIIVPEHVSFDNYHFLDLASQLLNSRDDLPSKDLLAKRTPLWDPFILALRNSEVYTRNGGGYLGLIATQIRKNGEIKQGKKTPYFELSSFQNLNNKKTLRKRLAINLKRKDFKEAHAIVDDAGHLKDQIDFIEEINSKLFEKQYKTKRNIVPFDASEFMESFIRLSRVNARNSKYAGFVHAFEEFDLINTNYRNRSDVRDDGKQLLDRNKITQREFEGILEIFDEVYNRTVSSSIFASKQLTYHTNRFSLRGDVKNDLVRKADDLTQETGEQLSQASEGEMRMLITEKRIEEDRRFYLLGQLEPVKGLLGRSFWNIVTDDEWVRSVSKIYQATKTNDHVRIAEAYHDHIERLSAMTDLIELKWANDSKSLVYFVANSKFWVAGGAELMKYPAGVVGAAVCSYVLSKYGVEVSPMVKWLAPLVSTLFTGGVGKKLSEDFAKDYVSKEDDKYIKRLLSEFVYSTQGTLMLQKHNLKGG